MPEKSELPPLVAEYSQALMLLQASHDFYHGILDALRKSTGDDGEPDLPELFKYMNVALRKFAPRDVEIRGLISKGEG